MAALPYMQFYVADYLADTIHLTAEENGAYLLLLFNYWQTGKPIPKSRLQKISRVPNERWTSVERALNEYFSDDGECWTHERIERDLKNVLDAQQQRSRAGKASAQKRKSQSKQEHEKSDSTGVERALNGRSTNIDTYTDNKKTKHSAQTPSEQDAQQSPQKIPPCPYEKIKDLYSEILPELRQPVIIDSYKPQIKARWRSTLNGKEKRVCHDLDFWRGYFNYVRKCPFLMGEVQPMNGSNAFQADLQWLTGPKNFAKVLEGKYER